MWNYLRTFTRMPDFNYQSKRREGNKICCQSSNDRACYWDRFHPIMDYDTGRLIMTDKNKDILQKLHLLTQDNGDMKKKTPLEIFFEADEMLHSLYDLIEDAQDTYENAKEVLFVEAGILKGPRPVTQLK